MASLPARTTSSFDAIKPVSSLVLLDNEFNQYVGASGFLNGGSTATKLLVKTSDGTDPPITVDQIGAGAILIGKQNGSTKFTVENDGDLLSNGITTAAGVVTFGSIPVGPASDPTTSNQLTRKSYVDAKTVSFSVGFIINDPSTANLNSRDFGSFIVPAGGTYTLSKGKVMYREGSHTAGGSLTFKIDLSGVGDKSTLTLDNTNNVKGQVYTDDFGDFTAIENSIFSCYISARSGTITEKSVAVVLEGFRTLI